MTDPTSSSDLVHASHIRLAYRAMLGREATPEEVRVQLGGLRTTGELLWILAESAEYTGQSRVLLDSTPGPSRANIWHPDLAEWNHQTGAMSGDGVAVVGHEGWLFIKGGTNSNVAQHTGERQMDAGWAEAWSELMQVRSAEAKQHGLTAVSLIIPDKLALLESKYPEPLTSTGRRPALRLVEELGLPITYPLEELRTASALADVYLRTDSHISLHGNDIVHRAVADALGVAPLDPATLADATSYVSSGDLGSLYDPKIVEPMRSMLSFGAATVAEDNRPALSARGAHIGTRRVLRNETAADPRTVVLYGDSYGFTDIGYEGLSWFLAQLFREVHFIWTPFGWDAEYATAVGAEIVVSQTAERFVGRVPAHRIDTLSVVAEGEGRPRATAPAPPGAGS